MYMDQGFMMSIENMQTWKNDKRLMPCENIAVNIFFLKTMILIANPNIINNEY